MENINNEKQFYLIYYKLILEKNEQLFTRDINNFSKQASIHNIKDIKSMITKLKNDKLLLSYKILVLLYTKSYLFQKIMRYQTNKKREQLITVIETLSKFKKDVEFINSFKLFPLILRPMSSESTHEVLKTGDNIWFDVSRTEIIHRIELIIKRFGIIMLHNLKLNIVHYDDILAMNYKQLSKYHNKIINKLKSYIVKTIDNCDEYISIEKSYVITLINYDTTIEFDNSDLSIEETTDNIIENEIFDNCD